MSEEVYFRLQPTGQSIVIVVKKSKLKRKRKTMGLFSSILNCIKGEKPTNKIPEQSMNDIRVTLRKDTDGGRFGGDFQSYDNLNHSEKVTIYHIHDEYGNVDTRETVDLAVPEPCGFDLNNVRLQTNNLIEAETGELIHSSSIVLMQDQNIQKTFNAWDEILDHVNISAKNINACWDSLFVQQMFQMMKSVQNNEIPQINKFGVDQYHFSATLTVEPLTATGKVKRSPIRTVLLLHSYFEIEPNGTLVLEASFNKEGKISKGTINNGPQEKHLIADFSLNRDGSYLVKRIR